LENAAPVKQGSTVSHGYNEANRDNEDDESDEEGGMGIKMVDNDLDDLAYCDPTPIDEY
jgi:hypothetical protein